MRSLLLAAVAALAVSLSPTASAQWGAIVTADRQICLSESGGYVHTRACTPAVNHFQARYVSGQNAFYIKTGSGGCLSAFEGAGGPVRSVGCNDADGNQRWWVNPTGQIQSQAKSNLCLDVERGLGRDRRVLNYPCDLNPVHAWRASNQRFYFSTGITYDPGLASRAATPSSLPNTSYVSTGLRGASIISRDGAGVISAGGGNVISAGGGNVVSAGGLN